MIENVKFFNSHSFCGLYYLQLIFTNFCEYYITLNVCLIWIWTNIEFKQQTDLELTQEADFERILQMEEEHIKRVTSEIVALKPDLVFTEKGISG